MVVKLKSARQRHRDRAAHKTGRGPQKKPLKFIKDLNLRLNWKYTLITERRLISLHKYLSKTYELPMLRRWYAPTDEGYIICVEAPPTKPRWDVLLRTRDLDPVKPLSQTYFRKLSEALIFAEKTYFMLHPVSAEFGIKKELTWHHGQER